MFRGSLEFLGVVTQRLSSFSPPPSTNLYLAAERSSPLLPSTLCGALPPRKYGRRRCGQLRATEGRTQDVLRLPARDGPGSRESSQATAAEGEQIADGESSYRVVLPIRDLDCDRAVDRKDGRAHISQSTAGKAEGRMRPGAV